MKDFNSFSESLEDQLNNIESEFNSHAIFGVHFIENRDGSHATKIYLTGKKDFHDYIGEGGSRAAGLGYLQNGLKPYMIAFGLNTDIEGMTRISKGIYEPTTPEPLQTTLKRYTHLGYNPIFQNAVSDQAKTDNTWIFHSRYDIEKDLLKIRYNIHNDTQIYLFIYEYKDIEKYWNNSDGGFDLMITTDPGDWDASEPDWDLVKGVIEDIGLVPEYSSGFSSECSISFKIDDQPDNIKGMSWKELTDLIYSKALSAGWKISSPRNSD